MGGDKAAPTTQESTAQTMQSFIANLPAYLKATNGALGPSAQAQYNADKSVSDPYAQLNYDIYSKYAPQFDAVGNQIQDADRKASAATDASILGGSGKDIAHNADSISRSLDPEFYKTRELESNKLSELLNSINLNGLSGGERAEVERSVNRDNAASGNVSTPSAINTVSNAMNFGSALNNKRNALSSALATATGFLPASRSNFDPTSLALGRPSQNNSTAQTPTAFSNAGAGGSNNANNLLSTIGGFTTQQNDINSQRRDSLDRVTGVLGSLPNVS